MKLIYDIIPPSEMRGKIIPSRNSIKGTILKIVSLMLIFGLNWFGLSTIGETLGLFNDIETSSNNIYTASNLDFSLNAEEWQLPEKATNLMLGDSVTRNVSVIKEGILDFQYNIQVIKTGGDDAFCNALQLKAELESNEKYSNGLMGLIIDPPIIIGADGRDDWIFTVTLPSDASGDLQEKTCEFKFVFNGWQIDFPDASSGFNDQEELDNTLESGRWQIGTGDVVINELMWPGSFWNPNDEWIELRNMKDYPIDISGWQLTKLVGNGKKEKLMLEIPSGKIIPANGYFLISNFDKKKSSINVEPDLVDPKVSLRNKFLQIKLYKADWQVSSNLIDTADNGSYLSAAGWHGFFFHLSMERDDIPGDGQLSRNWHTCFDYHNTRQYWDDGDIFNLGTPGAPNLSDESIEAQEALLAQYIQKEKELLAQGETPDLLLEEISEEEEPIDEPTSVPEEPLEKPVEQPLTEPIIEEEPINEPVEEQSQDTETEVPKETPDDQPVIKQDPVILPENPIVQNDAGDGGNGDDDNNSGDSDSADNASEGSDYVEVPVVTE